METLKFNGVDVSVTELERPTFGAILYKSNNSSDMFVVYLVSTGPFKIDLPQVYKLSVNEVMQYNSGKLDLLFLCNRLLSYAT